MALIAAIVWGFFAILILLNIVQNNYPDLDLKSFLQIAIANPLLWALAFSLLLSVFISIRLNKSLDNISQSGQYFESLFDVSPVAVVTLDLENKIITANQSFERLYGYKEKDIVGQELAPLLPLMKQKATQQN